MSQSASLNGGLSVNLINNFTPQQGQNYQILTFASETGNFSAEFGLYLGGGEGFSPTFTPGTNPTALDLAVISESAGTQTTVKSSENPSNYGDTVTFTATVAPAISTYLVPTGQVRFVDGSTQLETETLVNGAASYSTSALAAGSHSIVVQYVGDPNFAGSNSTTLTQAVNQISTTTVLAPSSASTTYGQPKTFTATVGSTIGAPPDGSVQFLVNGSNYGSPVPLSGATAQLAISEQAGSYTVATTYTGDANYAATLPAAETTAALTVNPVATTTAAQSATTIFSASNQTISLSATVTSSAGIVNEGTENLHGPERDDTGWNSRHCRRLPRGRHCQLYAARWYDSRHLHDRGRLQWDRRLRQFHRHEPVVDGQRRRPHDHVEHHHSPHRRRLGHTR